MGFKYDLNNQKKDKLSSNCLCACQILNTIILTFISTFLVAHIYKFSSDVFDYIFKVGIFQICTYGTLLATNWFFSYLTDCTNRIWIFRLAQIFRLIFVIVLIFYGTKLAQLLPVAGLLLGLSKGSYGASYNVLKQEMVSRKKMTRFSIFITIATKIMDIIIPVTLGTLIHVSTFEQTSIYVAVVIGIMLLLTFFIKAKKPEGSSYSLKGYFKKLNKHPQVKEKIKTIYKISFLYGFTTITNDLLKICIMLQFGSTLSLGSISSIIGAVTIIELILVTKFTKPAKRNWVYLIVMVLPIISSLTFIFVPSFTTVIIFNLLMSLSLIIFTAIFDIYRNSTLKESGLYSEISEHQTIVESTINISRVISYAIMILVGLLNNLAIFKVLLFVYSITYTLANASLLYYERKYLNDNKTCVVSLSEKQQEKQFQNIIKKLKKDW